MARLRVVTVITRLQAGGGGVALRGALALDRDDCEVTIVTGGAGLDGDAGTGRAADVLFGEEAIAGAPEGDLLPAAHAAGLRVARVPTLVPPISPGRDRAALRTLTRLLAEGGYDVVHTHSAKAGALGRLAGVRAGRARIVHTFHGFPFHEFQSTARRAAYVGLERRLGRHTDAFLAVGTAVATEALRRRLATAERMRTIPPAVDTVRRATGDGARAEALRRLGLPPDARVVGTVGRVDYQKAPEHFVDALAQQPEDVYGVWIGSGPLADAMLARVRQRGLTERFRWLGHRDDVPELLPGFDVFALASRYEGVPCVLVEAAGAGIPVVATAVNAVSDVVVPGETGLLVPPGQPRELGAAVGYLLAHPAEAARMAAAARDRLGDRYTPQALGAVLEETYRGPSRRPRAGRAGRDA
jgi:glycosyltransferase involved in cell wall biosynthesis